MDVTSWHKSAVREVRPFYGVSKLEDCLADAKIRLFDDADFSAEASFIVEPQDMAKLDVRVRPCLDGASLQTDVVKKSDLILAVTATQSFLKKTCVVGTYPASGVLPDEVAIGPEIFEQLGGPGHVTVNIALCLSKRLARKPGSPFLLGHWLSKKSFALRAPQPIDDFDIQPMTDDEWKALGFPPKTLYSVDYLGGFNEPAAKDRQLAKVRVHADVFKKLTVDSNQRLAKPIMAVLAAEITGHVLAASLQDWDSTDEVTKQSPLAAFLKRISRIQKCDVGLLRDMVKEPGMPRLKAILQSDQHSVRLIAEG